MCRKNNTSTYNYSIMAVVFATDDSILNISLDTGFSFFCRSLIPDIDHLDARFNMTAEGLRKEFETARIESVSPKVICIEKHSSPVLRIHEAEKWFDVQVDRDLIQID